MRHMAWFVGGALFAMLSAAEAAPGAPGSASPVGSASGGHHGGHDAGPRETPEQREYRFKYLIDTIEHERDVTLHHVWTPEMSHAANEHWRRAYRTLRVRELAEDDHDAALMGRADAFLKKIDAHFFTLLTELTAKAPLVPAAPKLVSPADQATVGVGSAATFKLNPYTDATGYFCTLYQPGHYWSNWVAGSKAFSTSPDCTIAADDPRWAKFRSGKAHFVGRAIVKGKSAKGTEMHLWSEPVKIDVTLTGGAAPAGSGSASPPVPAPSSSTAAGGSR